MLKRSVIIACVMFFTVLYFLSPVVSNIWCILTGRGYVIPKESSIFTFRATIVNDGTGEWWIYGEDRNYFYYMIEKESMVDSLKQNYVKYSKSNANKCDAFNSIDFNTWCR